MVDEAEAKGANAILGDALRHVRDGRELDRDLRLRHRRRSTSSSQRDLGALPRRATRRGSATSALSVASNRSGGQLRAADPQRAAGDLGCVTGRASSAASVRAKKTCVRQCDQSPRRREPASCVDEVPVERARQAGLLQRLPGRAGHEVLAALDAASAADARCPSAKGGLRMRASRFRGSRMKSVTS